jgi:hypothetical protein
MWVFLVSPDGEKGRFEEAGAAGRSLIQKNNRIAITLTQLQLKVNANEGRSPPVVIHAHTVRGCYIFKSRSPPRGYR